MLWFLLLLVPWAGIAAHSQDHKHTRETASPSPLLRPHIHYCRSPNMETFTCWWHFPGNGSQSDHNVTYTLTYTVGKGPKRECPDYVTSGPNSCYFDSQHTQVWEVYCMNVTARTSHAKYTSEEHCLDVAEIVETDPPFNLSYWLKNSTEDETGRTAVVSWLYPIAADVQMGWVTLVYELQFRRKSEPHNWKVKGVLREPRLELLDLPVGSYVVRVRCKSHYAGVWSKWSEPLTIDVPSPQTIDKMLAVILVSGVGVLFVLIIGFGVIPQGKRIKAFLLPPVPKPQIRGIDPMLLKNGKMDEITRLFSSFHGYMPPQYSAESWLHVSVDEGLPFVSEKEVMKEEVKEATPSTELPVCPKDQLQMQAGHAPYCETTPTDPKAPLPNLPVESPNPSPIYTEHMTPLIQGYSVMLNSTPVLAPPPCQDFYTCVNGISTSGTVHLVPCLPLDPAHCGQKGVAPKNSQPAVTGVKKAEPAASGVSASPGGVARAAAGGVGDNYTTLEDLSFHREGSEGIASAQGMVSTYQQEALLCSEHNELAVPLLPATTKRA
ncbi:prolactin receptor-like [Megalops cyprinoides]|uniref:prolactin receptor-like n=1 Tax=Megalops cyprinoides TaxID=118141 RepID=UPI001863B95C|nr:prolactin receptor-like [Megalops cyprinoides]